MTRTDDAPRPRYVASIELERAAPDRWTATEPGSTLVCEGATAPRAAARYCRRVAEGGVDGTRE